MSIEVRLPDHRGDLTTYQLGAPSDFARPAEPLRSRRAFAAAHVVANPLSDNGPTYPASVDWDTTLAFRRHLWSYGLSVAEAMDTAQRGMGLDWTATAELIRRSTREARAVGGDIACGAGTDQLPEDEPASLDDIVRAYEEQVELVEGEGGQAVVMASRALAATATSVDDYHYVYDRLLSQASRPVIIHWLGDMFDPKLAGYWGSRDLDTATENFLEILRARADDIDGVKISLLDKDREIDLRRRLPDGLRLYTGDDFDYPETILGDGQYHSEAFLGAFDLIAPAASAAIQALDAGEQGRFKEILEPTVPLSRHVFSPPTYYYKTGVVFLAYLNGHQDHFRMVGGLESGRSVVHLGEELVLADQAGLLTDPERAAERMARVLAVAGIEQ